jgi:hypothetical protein
MMASVTRAGILAIALVVGLSLATAPTPAHAKKTPGEKCEKEVNKRAKQYVKKRLKKVQKCANKAVKKGSGDLGTCLDNATSFKAIKDKKCSQEAMQEAGFLTPCEQLNPACASVGMIADAASLTSCMECHLRQVQNCMVATTYNISSPATASCFTPAESE